MNYNNEGVYTLEVSNVHGSTANKSIVVRFHHQTPSSMRFVNHDESLSPGVDSALFPHPSGSNNESAVKTSVRITAPIVSHSDDEAELPVLWL